MITITDIITEFGAYYLNNGQNLARLYKLIYRKSTTEAMLTSLVTEETQWRGSKALVNSVLQPFQKKWTPKGNATFTPLIINLFKMKVDYELYPDDIEQSWLGFLGDNNLDRKAWPLVRFLVEQHILPKMEEDYELEAIFYGRREEPADTVAGNPWQAMDGLRLVRNTAIKDGKTSPIVIGAWAANDDDLVDQFEEFVDGIDKRYWKIPMILGVNEDLERRYKRGFELKYGTQNNFQGVPATIKHSNISIMGLPSHGDSDIAWCTTPANAVRLMKKQQNVNNLRIENVDRLVKLFTDFYKGVGFVLPELIFTNDLDLGVPEITEVSPLVAGTAGGDEITLTGRDFTGATAVHFGTVSGSVFTPVGAGSSIDVVNDREMTFDSPAVSADTYAVRVTTPFGSGHSEEVVVVS
jgi:hypothetical protein